MVMIFVKVEIFLELIIAHRFNCSRQIESLQAELVVVGRLHPTCWHADRILAANYSCARQIGSSTWADLVV